METTHDLDIDYHINLNASTERVDGVPEDLWGPRRDPLYVVIPVSVFYSVIFVSGVIGNVSTCVVIARNRHMHTATNYYLFSLAVSDFLLLVIGLPSEMYSIWSKYPYVFGEKLCFLTGLAAETSTNATVLTITAFTVERYVAICHPFFSHKFSKLSRAIKFIILIWCISLIFALPLAVQFGIVYEVDPHGEMISEEYKACGMKHRVAYVFEMSAIVFFLVPMVVITGLYVGIALRLYTSNVVVSQRRAQGAAAAAAANAYGLRDSRRGHGNTKSTRRVVNMLMAVVAAFFLCWGPFQAQRLYAIHADSTGNPSTEAIIGYKIINYTSGMLYFFSATVNPILYNIMSLKFREAFKSTLKFCLNGKAPMRCGEPGGSSGAAGGGGSLLPGRFNYSVLSRRSYRCHNNNNNNNNSCSSGNSYVEGDLTRRPLVVSFKKRHPGKTSTTSLEPSPDKKPYLDVPRVGYHSDGPRHPSPRAVAVALDNPLAPVAKTPVSTPRQKNHIPRIEDIEIFQESQLKITRRGEKSDPLAQSRSIFIDTKHISPSDTKDTDGVKKSHTAPCLVIDSS